jgi:rRNA maturation protein Nop10
MCTCLYSSFSPTPPGSCRMPILFPIYHRLRCLKALLLTFNFEHHKLTSTFPFSCFSAAPSARSSTTISVPHSHVRRTGKCNLPFCLIEICSLSCAQPTWTHPSRFSPAQKQEHHVNGTFLSSHPPHSSSLLQNVPRR